MPTMQEFWKLLRGLLSLARQAINERLSQLSLTSAAGDVIYNLVTEGAGLSQEALCDRLGISKAAISRTVDSLVDKGFASRQRNPQDARAYLVRLTRQGRDVSRQVVDAYEGVFRLIQQGIPEADFVHASLLLHRVQHNLASQREGS